MSANLCSFTDVLGGDTDEIANSQPLSWPLSHDSAEFASSRTVANPVHTKTTRPLKYTGQHGDFRSVEEIDEKFRSVFTYSYFNLVQSGVIDDAVYSDKSMVVCAPTGSGKTVIFEMAIVQLLMELEDKYYTGNFKIIYMAPVKALCTERLTEWYSKFTKLGLLCIEVTGDTDVDFSQLTPYRIIITTPEKWDMLTRRWRDHISLVEEIKLFLIDEVHILNDETRGPVLEAVVSRMKTIESSAQSARRIEELQRQYQDNGEPSTSEASARSKALPPRIRFVAVSATVNNPEDVASWLGTKDKPAVYYRFGDECRPVKLKRVVEGYPCSDGASIFKFDIILNYKLWPVIQKYHDGKPTLIFCNTRKSVALTAEMLSRELTISFTPEQQAKLTSLASTIKNKKLQSLVLRGVGCHHAGLLYEERLSIERAFRNRDLPILITTTTLAMGVNLPAHLVIIKNTQQYVNGAYQEYSISTVLQMVGRAGRPQFDTEATAVIMTRLNDKPRYQALVGGSEPLQSYLHKRLPENLNSEAALGTVPDVAQCVQWLRSTFLFVRAARDPKWYLGLPSNAPSQLISKKIEELCVKAMNGLASAGLITMDEASCIESTEAGRLMSIYYLDLETMKHIMKIEGSESLEHLLGLVCESHELADMHLRMDERRCLNALNRNNAAATIRFPMKGKISTKQMKVNCMIQAILGCLPIPDPSLNQEAMKVMRIAQRVSKCLVAYITRPDLISKQPKFHSAVLNSLILNKCFAANLWENTPYVSKQLKGIGPTFSMLLATAGKVNFTLLEESHPRDLERIMNKGAPAGNVLRKQVGLLPRYQLTMTPIDEKRVSVQLMLINQTHLSENLEHLTAGHNHRCNLIVGDSENHLLMCTSFKDKDLISVYAGSITCEITRKHSLEHKIVAHCISSNIAGIDAQCEYTFVDLEPLFTRGEASIVYSVEDITAKKPTKKQTTITDVFKERKRKSNGNDIAQSKEKKKRDNALLEKFKCLKTSLGKASKVLKEDLDKSAEMSNKILLDMIKNDNHSIPNNLRDISKNAVNRFQPPEGNSEFVKEYEYPNTIDEDVDVDNFIVDDHINVILNEIESEISKSRNHSLLESNMTSASTSSIAVKNYVKTYPQVQNTFFGKTNDKGETVKPLLGINIYQYVKPQSYNSIYNSRKRKFTNTKSNYSFIDLLQKKTDLTGEDEVIPENNSRFTETIKNQMDKFLQSAQNNTYNSDIALKELVDSTQETVTPFSKKQVDSDRIIPLQDISDVVESKANDTQPTVVQKADKFKMKPNAYIIDIRDFANEENIDLNRHNNRNEDTIMDMPDVQDRIDFTEISKDVVILTETQEIINKMGKQFKKNCETDHTEPDYNYYIKELEALMDNASKQAVNVEIPSNPQETTKEQKITLKYNEYSKSDSTIEETNNFKQQKIDSNDDLPDTQKLHEIGDGNITKDIDLSANNNLSPHVDLILNSGKNNIAENIQISNEINSDAKDRRCLLQSNIIESVGENDNLRAAVTSSHQSIFSKDLIISRENMNIAFRLDNKYGMNKSTAASTKEIEVRRLTDITNKEGLIIMNKPFQNPTVPTKVILEPSNYIDDLPIEDPSITTKNNNEVISTPRGDVNKCKQENPRVAQFVPSIKNESTYNQYSNNTILQFRRDETDEFINKYSFTATKFDVCTKDTPEHKVQIVRKLIMDFDITEKVSKTKRNNQTATDNVDNSKERNRCNFEKSQHFNLQTPQTVTFNNPELESIRNSLTNDKIGKPNLKTEIVSRRNTETRNVENRKSFNIGKGKYLDVQTSPDINYNTKQNVEKHKAISKYGNILESKRDREHRNDSIVETNNKITEEVSSVSNKVDRDDEADVDLPREISNKDNKIKSTFEKYSRIFKKNNVIINTFDAKNQKEMTLKTDGKQHTSNETKQSTEKFKRPFKISNVHNIDITLPKTLIEEATRLPTPMPSNDDLLTRIKAMAPVKDVKPNQNDTFIQDPPTNHDSKIICEDSAEEITFIPDCSPPLSLETTELATDVIDRNMFNPQTFLQCYIGTDNLIIPPPIEFCDENSYSPTMQTIDDCMEELDATQNYVSNSLLEAQDQDSYALDIIHDTSIFADHTQDTLTASKEIETWTFDGDDSLEASYSPYPNPLQSCTVMRNNVSRSSGLTQSDRQTRLRNFKFTPKNKLRM